MAKVFLDDPFERSPPDVWLTSMWGFDPEIWGFLGFTEESDQRWFLERSKPGALVAVYVTTGPKAPPELRGKLVGILEIGARRGRGQDFMPGDHFAAKERDPSERNRWNNAIEVTRAWRVVPGQEPEIELLLPRTLGPSKGEGNHRRMIGRRGRRVDISELNKLKSLPVVETPVYRGRRTLDPDPCLLGEKLKTSRAVPRSTSPYSVDEEDGPKHLYILRLKGNLANFLDKTKDELVGMEVIKVGYSKAPDLRCRAFNKALPRCAFEWEVWKTENGDPPHANWRIAQDGEDAMKAKLADLGAEPLGGEFFLASSGAALNAWASGQKAASKSAKAACTNITGN